MKLKISYTYSTIIPNSKANQNGDYDETGWAYFNGCNLEIMGKDYHDRCSEIIEVETKEELNKFLSERVYFFETNKDNDFEGSFYGTDPDRDLHDGSETYYCAHVEIINEYNVIDYDVWGNKRDGYEVNDAFTTKFIIEIKENDTDKDIIKKLKAIGFLNKKLHFKSLQIKGEPDFTLYVNYVGSSKGGFYPLCELRKLNSIKE